MSCVPDAPVNSKGAPFWRRPRIFGDDSVTTVH